MNWFDANFHTGRCSIGVFFWKIHNPSVHTHFGEACREREGWRERGREEHVFGFILETESHIIPCRLRIPYHPLRKTHRYASRAQPCWAVFGIAAPTRNAASFSVEQKKKHKWHVEILKLQVFRSSDSSRGFLHQRWPTLSGQSLFLFFFNKRTKTCLTKAEIQQSTDGERMLILFYTCWYQNSSGFSHWYLNTSVWR